MDHDTDDADQTDATGALVPVNGTRPGELERAPAPTAGAEETARRAPSRRRLAVAAVALLVPVGLLGALALGGDEGDPAGSDAGVGDEADESAGTDAADAADPTSTAPPTADEADDAEGTREPGDAGAGGGDQADEPAAAPEVPSAPAAAGAEGDRPVVTYPQPTVPDGGCGAAEGTAVIELGDGPSPGCVRVGADQAVVFRNATGREISVVAEAVNEVVPAGGELRLGRAADGFPEGRSTFWSPGNPGLSGLVEVV